MVTLFSSDSLSDDFASAVMPASTPVMPASRLSDACIRDNLKCISNGKGRKSLRRRLYQ
jgi:hypothetical protein